MTQILDGKALAGKIREELKEEVQQLSKSGVTPSLTVILVGEDPASQVYVRNKERAATEVGIHSNVIRLSEETTQEELLEYVNKLNHDASIHGILVQLPLPKHIDTDAVLEAIVPEKDVDGFHPVNLGKLLQKDESIVPCTPQGIMEFFKENVSTEFSCFITVNPYIDHNGSFFHEVFCNESSFSDCTNQNISAFSNFR